MDRFIVSVSTETAAEYFNLKSNMDRFIGSIKVYTYDVDEYLKSNMDRFIVSFSHHHLKPSSSFKIQYG